MIGYFDKLIKKAICDRIYRRARLSRAENDALAATPRGLGVCFTTRCGSVAYREVLGLNNNTYAF